MRKMNKVLLPVLLAILVLCVGVAASDTKVVAKEDFTLNAGETLAGDLVAFGANVTLEKNSVVTGDVVILGGDADVNGRIDGDLASFGGKIRLGEESVITGDMVSFGGRVDRVPGAMVFGDAVEQGTLSVDKDEENGVTSIQKKISYAFPAGSSALEKVTRLFSGFFATVLSGVILGCITAVVMLVMESRVKDSARKLVFFPVQAAGLGLTAWFLCLCVIIVCTITIIGIPVAILLLLALILFNSYGTIVFGNWIGNMIGKKLSLSWTDLPLTVCGVVLTRILTGLMTSYIPCVGWLPGAVISFMGFGAVLIKLLKLLDADEKERMAMLESPDEE